MKKIEGKVIAEKILSALAKKNSKKFFAAFLVGENEASKKFLEQKKKVAELLGIEFRLYSFPGIISQGELHENILGVSSMDECGGIILQLPIPENLHAQEILNMIPKEKDVDVLGESARKDFFSGRGSIFPPAVGAFEEILLFLDIKLSESSVAVVGLGKLIGQPVAEYCAKRCKKFLSLDKGSDFEVLKNADILVLGTGSPALINASMIKKDACVIDFGYGTKNGKIMGDFDPSFLISDSSLLTYTPTPGGTGPILVARLFSNFYTLVENQERSYSSRK